MILFFKFQIINRLLILANKFLMIFFNIGQRVPFRNFKQFLYIRHQLFTLEIVNNNNKENKKVLLKDENFQISKHQSSLRIGQCDSLEIFNNIYI